VAGGREGDGRRCGKGKCCVFGKKECTLYALANSSSKTLVDYGFAKAMKKVANVGHLFLFFTNILQLNESKIK